MFDINFNKLFERLTPYFLRTPILLKFITVFANEIKYVNTLFLAFWNALIFKMKFNSQDIYLEKYLNTLYDPTGNGIYIDTIATDGNVYLFLTAEANEETYLFLTSEAQPDTYFRLQSEAVSDLDFIVYVPVAVTYTNLVMRSQIDFYRLAGKRFEIQTY